MRNSIDLQLKPNRKISVNSQKNLILTDDGIVVGRLDKNLSITNINSNLNTPSENTELLMAALSNGNTDKNNNDEKLISLNNNNNNNETYQKPLHLNLTKHNGVDLSINSLEENGVLIGHLSSKDSTPQSEGYFYLVKPRLVQNQAKTELAEPNEVKQNEFECSLKSLNNAVEPINENTIRIVVEKCFDQISKNKKIDSPCIYVKQKSSSSNQIKLIDINPCSNTSEDNCYDDTTELIEKSTKESFSKSRNKSNSSSKIEKSENSNDVEVSSLSSSSSIENSRIKQTVVEKAVDLMNGPTNTILLSSTNEINELYSLKITFV